MANQSQKSGEGVHLFMQVHLFGKIHYFPEFLVSSTKCYWHIFEDVRCLDMERVLTLTMITVERVHALSRQARPVQTQQAANYDNLWCFVMKLGNGIQDTWPQRHCCNVSLVTRKSTASNLPWYVHIKCYRNRVKYDSNVGNSWPSECHMHKDELFRVSRLPLTQFHRCKIGIESTECHLQEHDTGMCSKISRSRQLLGAEKWNQKAEM